MEAALGAIDGAMQSIKNEYAETGQTVAAWEKIVNALEPHRSLLFKQSCAPDRVGVLPQNRPGLRLSVSKTYLNAARHCLAGWSYKKASAGAWATTPPSAKEELQKYTEVNTEISENQPEFPPLSDHALFSFGGPHGNGFLRAVLGGSACAVESLAKGGGLGFLDKDALQHQHPSIALALDQGLEWNVFHHEVFTRWPWALTIGQKALNNNGASEISEMEGMLSISQSLEGFARAGMPEGERKTAAAADAKRMDAFWGGWSEALIDFSAVVCYEQLKEASDSLSSILKSADQMFLGGAYIQRAASLSWPNAVVPMSRVRMAAVTANLLSPMSRLQDGKCTLIKDSALLKLTQKSNQDAVIVAEKMMDLARSCCDKKENLGQDQTPEHRVFGRAPHLLLDGAGETVGGSEGLRYLV